MNNETLVIKMKKGSLVIGIICCLIAVFLLFCSISTFSEYHSVLNVEDQRNIPTYVDKFVFMFNGFTHIFSAAIMATAATLFFFVAKTGIPFANKTMNIVRTIGIVQFLKAIIPCLIPIILVGYHREFFGMIITSTPLYLLMGLLFFLMSYIVKYGSQLQQESDETL